MDDSRMQLHAAYTTPPADIAAVVERITTSPIVQRDKIIGGIDNEVHAVATADGTRVVVHVRRHGELPFEDIAWALGQARAAGVPVPEVLLCDRAAIDGAEREVMIQVALLGRPLDALLATLDHAQLRSCYYQAAAALVVHQRDCDE